MVEDTSDWIKFTFNYNMFYPGLVTGERERERCKYLLDYFRQHYNTSYLATLYTIPTLIKQERAKHQRLLLLGAPQFQLFPSTLLTSY